MMYDVDTCVLHTCVLKESLTHVRFVDPSYSICHHKPSWGPQGDMDTTHESVGPFLTSLCGLPNASLSQNPRRVGMHR